MAFSNVNTLTTRETVFGNKRLGQILAVPSGRIDKVSLYLEPVLGTSADNVDVIVETYAIDALGNPVGSALSSDSKTLSDITIRGYQNFRLEASTPSVIAVVLRTMNGDPDNCVGWRYTGISSGGEELLVSLDAGASWAADPTRKFAYRTFSYSSKVDADQQTAAIAGGELKTDVETGSDFSLGILTRTAVTGETLAINFGDFVITAVVDQSGSMTWNDREGLRYDFLLDLLADIEASIPSSSDISYSLIKFRGRRVGSLSIAVQGTENFGLHLDGVRLVRKAGSAPTGITDGLIVFEGLAEQYVDDGSVAPLSLGTTYYYSAFAFAEFDDNTLYSSGKTDVIELETPVKAPVSIVGFEAEAEKTDASGTILDFTEDPEPVDYGYRKVLLSWINPQGANYSTITLVRRDDRMPESKTDGTILLADVSSSTTSYVDTFSGTYSPITGLKYYYRIFTRNSIGVKGLTVNSLSNEVLIPSVDRPWERMEPPDDTPPVGFDLTSPGAPTVAVTESNGEIRLVWTPADVGSKRFKLYYDDTKFPAVTNERGSEFSGDLLYDGPGTSFSHRFLTNGEPHFYAIIALDNVENASSPVFPTVGGKPPKPSEEAVDFLAPDPISNLSAEAINATSIRVAWENPKAPDDVANSFYFGDSVRVVATAQFLDSGDSESFMVFEFVEGERSVGWVDDADTVDEKVAITVAASPSNIPETITAVVSVSSLLSIQNKMDTAGIRLAAALRVKNRTTGEILAEVKTPEISLAFSHPFSLKVENEPAQRVSVREWVEAENSEGLPCVPKEYKVDEVPGVYVNSGDPFFALIEGKFRGEAITGPLAVTLELLDAETSEPSDLFKLAGSDDDNALLLDLEQIQDEVLDRSGEPTGELVTRSVAFTTLPPSSVPGNVILKATATYNGYVRSHELEAHFEPTLNIDLTLRPFEANNVDRAEQSAFVYFAPFDALAQDKVPVPDFTITNWSIRPLCSSAKIRPIVSEDTVPGLGVKSYAVGGLARKIFWGPGEDVFDQQLYEVHVKVQAGGQSGEGFGLLELLPPSAYSPNKIFLRNADTDKFYIEQIYADGESLSSWEVIAKPEDDAGEGVSDTTSGQAFKAAVLGATGVVPSLEDGRIITLAAKVVNQADPEGNSPTLADISAIANSIRIKTNLTGASGKAGATRAKVVGGKATFQVTVNASVPKKKEGIEQEELEDNLFYKLYGVKFEKPQSGIYIALTAYASLEINGKAVSFQGGGGDLVVSAPPAFIELKEPLAIK